MVGLRGSRTGSRDLQMQENKEGDDLPRPRASHVSTKASVSNRDYRPGLRRAPDIVDAFYRI
jgi:hypothetical protein